ncbi:MAG: hypothetical protein PVF61_06970, partial [Gammaproteobacteria bacterium]
MIKIVFILLLLAAAPALAQPDPVSDALHARLEALQFTGDLEIDGAKIAARELLPAVYANRQFQPLWTDEHRIAEYLALVATAPRDGLEPEDY